MANDVIGDQLMNILAVMSAYLVACYVVGNRLSLVQHVGLALLYSISILILIGGLWVLTEANYATALEFEREYPNHAYKTFRAANPWMTIFIPAISLVGWLFSLTYGFSSRESKKGDT